MSYQILHDKNSDKRNVYLIRCPIRSYTIKIPSYQTLHDKNSDKGNVYLIRCPIRSYTIKIPLTRNFIVQADKRNFYRVRSD